MKMNKGSTSVPKSTSDNLIDLYTRIPDYAEVQHLGQSDFINTLEKLKEEFRQCRASLYNEEFCSDSEYLAGKSSPGANDGRSKTNENLLYYSTKYGKGESGCGIGHLGDSGKVTLKINNHSSNSHCNLTTAQAHLHEERNEGENTNHGTGGRGQYLSIKSCELHRTPYRATSASSLINPTRYIEAYGRSSLLEDRGKNDGTFRDYESDDDDDDDNDDDYLHRTTREWSVDSDNNSDISISKWSSSPEIYRSRSRSKEFLPPSNTEKRSLQRKFRNNSAPSVAFKEEEDDVPKTSFKANPVPAHVYKPLYEFIMLKNQRRSEKIREQSKRRLLSQMKPFSFCKDSNSNRSTSHAGRLNRSAESLNNTKPLKKRRNDSLNNVKTNNNRLNSATMAIFKAKPAPPRTKALLAAIRQKEQQEYRELKKRLRAELLLKNASLPPSMAAREKRAKLTNAKIDEVLKDYQKSFSENRKNRMARNYREMSTGTDDTGLLTDDDRMTDDDYSGATVRTKKITTIMKPFKFSQRNPKRFTSFGTSRHSAAATGVFEASSNDNLASRLRYEAAKKKEEERMKHEEEEMIRLIRAERRRQKLRDSHLHAWQHACSYSAEQDIAMRRQLRHAAAILERETFVRDMSCMLSRVRSAPLLLEGGDRLERKQVPCKKHRDEFRKQNSSGGADDRLWNKLSTPRLYTSWSGQKHGSSGRFDRYGADDKSETAALAEGSLSNSDNESGDEHENMNREYQNKKGGSLDTDSGPSDLEEENGNNNKNRMSGGNRDDGDEENEEDHALSTDNEISDEAEADEGQNNEAHLNENDARENERQSQEN